VATVTDCKYLPPWISVSTPSPTSNTAVLAEPAPPTNAEPLATSGTTFAVVMLPLNVIV